MEAEATRWFSAFRGHLAAGALALPRCPSCSRFHWYPKSVCPHCARAGWTWHEVSGRGTLFTWTTVHQSFVSNASAPYTVVLVEMAEDRAIRLVGNLDSSARADGLKAGMTMTVQFGATSAAGSVDLPVFAPAPRNSRRFEDGDTDT